MSCTDREMGGASWLRVGFLAQSLPRHRSGRACVCAYVHAVRVCVYLRIGVHIHAYVCVCACMRVCVHVHMYVYVCICVYVNVCIYIYIHTRVGVHMHSCRRIFVYLYCPISLLHACVSQFFV